jgi:hypothetical protein
MSLSMRDGAEIAVPVLVEGEAGQGEGLLADWGDVDLRHGDAGGARLQEYVQQDYGQEDNPDNEFIPGKYLVQDIIYFVQDTDNENRGSENGPHEQGLQAGQDQRVPEGQEDGGATQENGQVQRIRLEIGEQQPGKPSNEILIDMFMAGSLATVQTGPILEGDQGVRVARGGEGPHDEVVRVDDQRGGEGVHGQGVREGGGGQVQDRMLGLVQADSSSRKKTPTAKRKREVPDGLVQTRLTNFISKFPNLIKMPSAGNLFCTDQGPCNTRSNKENVGGPC